MHTFWQRLPKPFFCLAPMADVTDAAFRRIVTTCGKPDVLWTEFVSADGLCHPVGREKLLIDLQYTEGERPLVAQLFSSNPENMRKAAYECAKRGFDGIDINMGCPDRTIEKQGCGSAMIKTPDVALTIIAAARAGVADAGKDIPISVKTRVGYSHDEIDTWIRLLLEQRLPALTIHARTRKDLSQVPARWEYVARVVALKNEISPETIIIGNGDVMSYDDGVQKAYETGCDGIMIGRAVFGNPWIFNRTVSIARKGSWHQHFFLRWLPHTWAKKILGDKRYTVADIPLEEKLNTMIEHTRLFHTLLGKEKNFAVMKKHYKAYAHGFPGAKELRVQLMETHTLQEVEHCVETFLKKYHTSQPLG